MTIKTERPNKTTVILFVEGRLDAATSSQLERKIKQWGNDIPELILDFAGLAYISSMGLRILLQAQKALASNGNRLVIKNMTQTVREVFEMTGFIKLLVQDEKFVVIRKNGENNITLSLIGALEFDKVPLLSAELVTIKEENSGKNNLEVNLDLEKLESISEAACHGLKEALDETAWPDRKLFFHSAAEEIRKNLVDEGLGGMFA